MNALAGCNAEPAQMPQCVLEESQSGSSYPLTESMQYFVTQQILMRLQRTTKDEKALVPCCLC